MRATETIWKFPLPVTNRVVVEMPKGATILCVQSQGDGPCIWARVTPAAPKELRTFNIFGTGHPLPNNPGRYLATVQTHGGGLVWHVFEVTNQSEGR